ncbi:redoxin domain protein [Formosa agariphila KMM 3901]|uniref:Redoxin domain protein n=1 Tax=Formosa agariphila (strain DSM 15362 / KCTC 12365 / LMG 23005 / KMM 3901 / M-2Alg 35-1) TaxID=1347342 RepID=T2KIX8_FORAG|nr:TlpA disulfide reductase family protein [Formosa agariphila]CDF78827.1 redoxin domain protein [Formosa agariphila KMM 3901]
MRYFLLLSVAICLFNCKQPESEKLEEGMWRATIEAQDSEVLPFNFEVVNDSTLTVFNAEEEIKVDEISFKNDSVIIKLPVFEGYLKAKLTAGKSLNGFFIIDELKRAVPFKAEYGVSHRFETSKKAEVNVDGIWETTFSPDSPDDKYKAKGIFKQDGDRVTGTFRTTTGDYRFLEGSVEGNTMKLSAFDGAHAFLFTADVNDSTMTGTFYSGNHFKESFKAKRNGMFELADADSLTFLKPGYDALAFTFSDASGNMVSLSDAQFKNKVVVVQLMGTWCPNCLDESKYFVEYLKANNSDDIAFIGLAFEYAKTKEKAFENIQRLKSRLGITYPILLAQYGSTNKKSAQEKLPMLNHVLSYPTAIYIDKKGKVRKIHTGFNGPATGDLYDDYKSDFKSFIDKLLNE